MVIELHYRDGDAANLWNFMHGMHAHGFRIFHREANVLDVQRCWEYSFVRAVAPPSLASGEGRPRAAKADLSREHTFVSGLTELGPLADGDSTAESLAIGAVPSSHDRELLTEYLGGCLEGDAGRHSLSKAWFRGFE